jgi:hypothetical protein
MRLLLFFQPSTLSPQPVSLPFIFALADFLENGETRLFRIRKGDRLELLRGTETGNDFTNRFFARGAIRQRLGRKRTVQGEFPATHLAIAFAQFIFVNRHKSTLILLRLRFPPFLQFYFCNLDLFRAENAFALDFLDHFFGAMDVAAI